LENAYISRPVPVALSNDWTPRPGFLLGFAYIRLGILPAHEVYGMLRKVLALVRREIYDIKKQVEERLLTDGNL